MAKLPTQRRLWPSDSNAPEWAKRLVDSLNTFMQDVIEALNGRLKVGSNIALDFVTVQLNGSNPTTEFDSSLGRPLAGLFVAQIQIGASAGAVSLNWQEIGGRVSVSFQGLTVATDYQIKLLLV